MATMTTLFLRRTPGSDFTLEDTALTTGNRFFVHSSAGTDRSTNGAKPSLPFATLAYAISQAVANQGDRIFLMPGYTETLTAVVTVNVAGLSIIGLGEGVDRPEFLVNYVGDGLNITASDVVIENLYIHEATAAATANINIAAPRVAVRGCQFDLGANDLDNITVTALGDQSVIEDNVFLVTANGPDSAVTIEGACDDLVIRRNRFSGGSTTNTWDDAAIDFGSTTPLNVRIVDNDFAYGTAVVSTGATPRIMGRNVYLRGARPCAGASIDIYASASVTGTKSGTAEDPTTIQDAVDLAAAGDRVLLYPGTYTLTATIALDVTGVTVQPVHYTAGKRSQDVEVAADGAGLSCFDVTAANCSLLGLYMTSSTNATSDGTEYVDCDSSGLTIRDCTFDMEARTNRDAINFATATTRHLVDNCLFTAGAAGKSYIVWACGASEFKNNLFDSTAAIVVCFEQIASPGNGVFVHHNYIVSSGSAGGGIGSTASWQASPLKQVFADNRIFGTAGDVDSCGDDADLDAYFYSNTRDGDTAGAVTVLNPSVT